MPVDVRTTRWIMDDDLFAVFGGEQKPTPGTSTSQAPADSSPSKEKKRKREQKAGSSNGTTENGVDEASSIDENGDVEAAAVEAVKSEQMSPVKSHKKQKKRKESSRRRSASQDGENGLHAKEEPPATTSMAIDGQREQTSHRKGGYHRRDVAVDLAEPLEDQPLLADEFQQEAHVDVAVSSGLQGSSAAAGASDESSGKITLSHQVRHQVALPPNYPYIPISQHKPPPVPARVYPFELDPFQKVSVASIQRNESVLVSAHTSAGKTVVAEYAIAQCLRDKQRVIYTSPIKVSSDRLLNASQH